MHACTLTETCVQHAHSGRACLHIPVFPMCKHTGHICTPCRLTPSTLVCAMSHTGVNTHMHMPHTYTVHTLTL